MFKYIGVFSDDTSQAKTTIMQISDSTITIIASNTGTSVYTYTAPDGLKIVVTRLTSVVITPPSGKALRCINFQQGSVGSLRTLNTNQSWTTVTTVFGNIALFGYV